MLPAKKMPPIAAAEMSMRFMAGTSVSQLKYSIWPRIPVKTITRSAIKYSCRYMVKLIFFMTDAK